MPCRGKTTVGPFPPHASKIDRRLRRRAGTPKRKHMRLSVKLTVHQSRTRQLPRIGHGGSRVAVICGGDRALCGGIEVSIAPQIPALAVNGERPVFFFFLPTAIRNLSSLPAADEQGCEMAPSSSCSVQRAAVTGNPRYTLYG